MPQQGAVYGTVSYGDATYGRPLDLTGTALPQYSASPAVATPLDYQTIQVAWSLPVSGVTLQLVRNGRSVPSDETDGAILVSQPLTARPVFIDNTLTTDSAGNIFYYTLWNQDSSGNWWRAADIQTVLPKDWGYADMLTGLLPEMFMADDDALATSFTVQQPTAAWSTLTNSTWADLANYTWDTIP